MRIRVEFKPEDCWIGAFWRTTETCMGFRWQFDLWICIVPMLPIHITTEGINR